MKKIMWESWNEKEIELLESQPLDFMSGEESEDNEQLLNASINEGLGSLLEMGPSLIHTPFGNVPSESALKPSDRWHCWLGYTNFDLTHKISDKIKIISGVEALKIMSRYTFCVGVGKMFNFTSVKREIENAICKR
jgi:hypothetical protein